MWLGGLEKKGNGREDRTTLRGNERGLREWGPFEVGGC